MIQLVKAIRFATVAGVLAAGAGTAWAQAGTPPAPPPASDHRMPIPGDGRTPDQLRGEVIERMRALRAWKLVDALKLDQATSARLFPILSKFDDREMAVMKERHEAVRELRFESEAPTPNSTKITAAIDRLLSARTKRRALEDERIREVRKVLTPVQQAKLVLLWPRIERGFARRIHDVADERRQGGERGQRGQGHERRGLRGGGDFGF